jgi:hypothetical protein
MKDNQIYIGIVALMVIALAFSYGSPSNLTTGQSITPDSAFTIRSITPSKIISNDADLASANFQINAVINNGGQSIVGTIGTDTFKKESGFTSTYPLTISMSAIKETLTYNIGNEGQLFKWDIKTSDVFSWSVDEKKYCLAGYQCVLKTIPGAWYAGNTYQVISVKPIPMGNFGYFSKPNINWAGKITMSINGRSITKDIGSIDTAIDFSDDRGWFGNAKWIGSLITGTATPQETAFKAIHLTDAPSWKVAQAVTYNTYVTSLSYSKTEVNRLSSLTTYTTSMSDDLLTAVNNHNAKYDQLINEDLTITYVSGTEEALKREPSASNVIIESTNRRIANPELVLTVKASELGILIPVGKPQIIPPIDSPSFASGSNNGYAIANFKNIGAATGTFAATVTDTSGIYTQTSTSPQVSVSPGSTGTIRVEISHGSSAEKISKTATMKVFEYNKPSNYDEESFVISMTIPKTCTPNAKRVDGKIVWVCSTDGMTESIFLDCTSTGLDYKDGKYSCIVNSGGTPAGTPSPSPSPAPTGTGTSGNTTVSKWYENTWLYIGLGIVLISALYYRYGKRGK